MNVSSARWFRAYARRALYGVAVAVVCVQAVAQEKLQEVVVTAERREEKLQDVPVAVTAFTADTLRSKNLTDLHSLSNLTPNVNLDGGAPFSGDRSVLSASIRGIGQDDFAFNLNPGVGVYLDGVYLARTIGANLSLLDVDRIEILKGPQGTLFGANTIGGAISVVTHTPGNTPRFIGTATAGRYNRRDFAFTADLPIIQDKLLSSISVSTQNQTGWVSVIPYPTNSPQGSAPFIVDPQNVYPKAGYQTSDNYGGTGVTSLRAKVLWNASDKFKMTFTGDWSHEDQTALPYTVLGVYSGNLNASTFSTLYNVCISNNASTLPLRPTAPSRARRSPAFRSAARRSWVRGMWAVHPDRSTSTTTPARVISAPTSRVCTSTLPQRIPATSIRATRTVRTSRATTRSEARSRASTT